MRKPDTAGGYTPGHLEAVRGACLASDLTAKERRLLKAALEEEKRQRARRRVTGRE